VSRFTKTQARVELQRDLGECHFHGQSNRGECPLCNLWQNHRRQLYGPLRLPPILPHNLMLYAWLRELHTDLAYLFFATFLAHFGAALFHGLIRRDGVFKSMASWR
jgi:hypothetical protein